MGDETNAGLEADVVFFRKIGIGFILLTTAAGLMSLCVLLTSTENVTAGSVLNVAKISQSQ